MKGWHTHSQTCINYTRQRCEKADQEVSLELSWLRERFSTVGKSYRIISVHSETEGFKHDLVEVEIGENKFLLFHNRHPGTLTNVLVDVYKVNGIEMVIDEIRKMGYPSKDYSKRPSIRSR